MKKEVFRHLHETYGRLPLLWVGIVTEIVRTILQRIFSVLVVAHLASNIASGNIAAAKRDILIFVIIYIAGATMGVIGELLAIHTTDKKYQELLIRYHQKLTGKDMAFYRDNRTGSLGSAFRQHLDGTMGLVRLFRGDVIRMFILLVAPVVVLFIVNWQLGSTLACIVAVQSIYVIWASDQANKYRKYSQEIYQKLSGEVADEVTNMVAFKSSGGEKYAHDKVAQLAAEEAKVFWRRHKKTTLLDLLGSVLTGLAIGISIFIALTSASSHLESIGLIVLMFIYILQVMNNIADLPDLVGRLDEKFTKVYATLEHLTKKHETVLDPAQPKQLVIVQGTIQIINVGFSYKESRNGVGTNKIFDRLNIAIEGGKHFGIVGLSGVGKSTLANLLMRFDDVTTGSITIDGIDLRDVRQNELRQKIAYVPQEPSLFHRTIKENITYFKRDATDAEIIRAAKAAHAHEFITKLSDSYNTVVGERGIKLSGGEKQRIVIARAILQNAPIMIFDEATSALDSESEKIIQNALPGIIGTHTALVIAHRLSTVAQLDRIFVMHDGRITEEGTHEELLTLRGRYYSLWQKQNGSNES